MIEIKPPQPLDPLPPWVTVFLAGSIEEGRAEKWQNYVANKLANSVCGDELVVLNPRRDNWDNSWEQSIKDKNFSEQVRWELEAQEKSEIILFYFDPDTKSPITLMELGMAAVRSGYGSFEGLAVCCPEGYWRKGNVDIICLEYGIAMVDSLDGLVDYAKEIIR